MSGANGRLHHSSRLINKKRLALLQKTRRLRFYQELLKHADHLIQHLAIDMKLSQEKILGCSRKTQPVMARAILYRVLYKSYSLEDVAYVFNKHHTTVMYSLKLLESELYKQNPKVIKYLKNLEQQDNIYVKLQLEDLTKEYNL